MDQTWRFAGSGEEAESAMKEETKGKRHEKLMRTWVVSMAVASMMGGLVFGWWEFQFQSTNRQLWMVPFGLVLVISPIFVMMSVLITSFFCTSMDHKSSIITPCDPTI